MIKAKAKSDYAYAPDDDPSHWKLDISDAKHTGLAKAALGKGYRGNKVKIPDDALQGVIDKVNEACKKFGLEPLTAKLDSVFSYLDENNDHLNREDIDEYFKQSDSEEHRGESHGDSVAMILNGYETDSDPHIVIFNDGDIVSEDGRYFFDTIDQAQEWLINTIQDNNERAVMSNFATASVKKANLDGWEEDEPGTFYKEFSNGIEGLVGDATGNGFGYTILNNTDSDLPSDDMHSKDGFDSIEEAEAAADAWYEANESAIAFASVASRHQSRRIRKSALTWIRDSNDSDYNEGTLLPNDHFIYLYEDKDEGDSPAYYWNEYVGGLVENSAGPFASSEEAKADVERRFADVTASVKKAEDAAWYQADDTRWFSPYGDAYTLYVDRMQDDTWSWSIENIDTEDVVASGDGYSDIEEARAAVEAKAIELNLNKTTANKKVNEKMSAKNIASVKTAGYVVDEATVNGQSAYISEQPCWDENGNASNTYIIVVGIHEYGEHYSTEEEAVAALNAIADDGVTDVKTASVKQAHDVEYLDIAIEALSSQLALDPDTKLADIIDELSKFRDDEKSETAEDEIEEHGENVPITE